MTGKRKRVGAVMNKKTRDIKKADRYAARAAKEFQVDYSSGKWFDFWHKHLDPWGMTVNQPKRRKKYMLHYSNMLDAVQAQSAAWDKPFQTWIHVSEDGETDALFFHTPNKTGDFPYKDSEMIEWDVKLPVWLHEMIDPSQYRFGMVPYNGLTQYIIQKRGLGIPVY